MIIKVHKSGLVKQSFSTFEETVNAFIADSATRNDPHRERAAEMFGIAYDDVTDDQRRFAKAINFHTHYGGYGA